MKWDYENYIEWKNSGSPINLEVTELNISNRHIKSLEGINNLTNLQVLNCYGNKIVSLEGINNLINLRILWCGCNQLISLEGINNLVNLQVLSCSENELKSLVNSLNNLVNLQVLGCSYNQLKSLEGINNLTNLQVLHCSKNQLTSLEGINNLINLQELYCSENQLTSLEGINNLINLRVLDCSYNQIESLNEINNLHNLLVLFYSNNPIEYIPPNITRLLNRIENNQDIYNDQQNVHNHNVQECIRQSIQNVLNVRPLNANIYDLILADNILTQETKEILINYSNDKEVHSTLNVTFEELLTHVFGSIESNPNNEEIKSILNIEMNDSLCKCFTGRMSRLINCLNGFDPLVKIEISENEQIGQIIGKIKEKLEMNDQYTIESHREMVKSEMVDRGYSEDKINEWVQHIE